MNQLDPASVLYQDDDLIAINKPSGLLVHPGQGGVRGEVTLMELARDFLGKWVYPIHRIDRPVSGIVILLLKPEMVAPLQKNWNGPNTQKIYLALARRTITEPGTFNFPLSGLEAHTDYTPLSYAEFATFVKIQIHTGRTHQIRRHFGRRMHNIVGDTTHGKGDVNRLYKEKYGLNRIFLHCHQMSFLHPQSNTPIEITAPLTQDLSDVLKKASSPINLNI